MVGWALVFVGSVCLLCKAHADVQVTTAGDHNKTLANGPRPNETRRFLYRVNGRPFYCMICGEDALADTTYLYEQQTECYRGGSYKGKFTKYEMENGKYAVCNVGKTPGCSKPPSLGEPNLKWHCSKGYNNEVYSVYFTCQLVCNYTQKVLSQIYCNESLVWHTDFKEDLVCAGPVKPVTKGSFSVTIAVAITAAVLLVLVIIAVLVICICCRRKRSSPPSSPIPEIEIPTITRRFTMTGSIGFCSLIDEPGMNIPDKHDDDQNNNDHEDEGIEREQVDEDSNEQADAESKDTEEEEEEEGDDECNETSKLLPEKAETKKEDGNEQQAKDGNKEIDDEDEDCNESFKLVKSNNKITKETPDIRVFSHSNIRDSREGRLQENMYSVPRGSTFYIVPSSPQCIAITEFVVVRKGEGRPYRGEPCPELNLNFFNIVNDADDQDAGRYIGYITLENGERYQREFEIFISAVGENAEEDLEDVPNPVPSIPANPGIDPNDVQEINDAFDSGEKSEEVEGQGGRMEPEGAEAQPSFVNSGRPGQSKNGPQGQNVINQIAALQQQAQQQSRQQNTDKSISQSGQEHSVPHLMPDSLMASNQRQESSNVSLHPIENDDSGAIGACGLSLSTLLSNQDNDSNQTGKNVDSNQGVNINPGNPAVRGEVSASFGSSNYTQNNQRSDNPIDDGNCGNILSAIESSSPLVNAPYLNPNSVLNPSCSRDDPAGVSRDIQFVEESNAGSLSLVDSDPQCQSIEDNNDIPDVQVGNDTRNQTARKQVQTDMGRCCANLGNLQNLAYLERLCHMADPREAHGNRGSWFGFGQHSGLSMHFLQAVEYHRRGFINDGPMRAVLRELGNRPVYNLVAYFLQHNRLDIVDLTLDNCPDHQNCQVCLDARSRHRPVRR